MVGGELESWRVGELGSLDRLIGKLPKHLIRQDVCGTSLGALERRYRNPVSDLQQSKSRSLAHQEIGFLAILNRSSSAEQGKTGVSGDLVPGGACNRFKQEPRGRGC
jgi:hypothetical protein